LVTNNRKLWNKAWSYKDHGKNYEKIGDNLNTFQFVHDSFGTNFRMTEMQAAIGRLQLKKLNGWVDIRRQNASLLNQAISEFSIFRATIPERHFTHAYYKYYFFVNDELLSEGWTRDKIVNAVNAEGIPCFTGTCPEIYKEEAFRQYNSEQHESLPNAKILGETSVMLMVHPTIGAKEIHDVYETLRKISLAVEN
jgi:dTDP-4-amino-4,6-dideoxygalactose transaminase